MFNFYKHHKRRINKWLLRIVFGLLTLVIIYQRDKIKIERLEKEKNAYKLELYENVVIKRLEKVELFSENFQNTFQSGNESIYAKEIINKTRQTYFRNNMSTYQKELQKELHGKYELRYTWMTFPMDNYYVNSEFGVRRYYKGNTFGHTGIDGNSVDSEIVRASFDGKVIDRGYDSLGGYYVIISRDEIEYDEKLKKYKLVTYDSYVGHLSKIDVKLNQHVFQKERLGLVGDSGDYCDGIHVHWSIKRNGKLMNPVANSTYKGNKLISSIKDTVMCY
jgi:murein DD-endopeptidase MepM/ murein hydrolase activator NlpD